MPPEELIGVIVDVIGLLERLAPAAAAPVESGIDTPPGPPGRVKIAPKDVAPPAPPAFCPAAAGVPPEPMTIDTGALNAETGIKTSIY